jgi:hypothetical protein
MLGRRRSKATSSHLDPQSDAWRASVVARRLSPLPSDILTGAVPALPPGSGGHPRTA